MDTESKLISGRHVQEHPCLMFFGAVSLGFAGAYLMDGAGATSKNTPEPGPAPADSTHAPTVHKNGKHRRPSSPKPALWQRIANHYSEELAKVEGVALGVVAAIIRETLASRAPPALAQQITEIMDGVTTKFGGIPIRGPLFQPSAPAATKEHQKEIESKEQWME